MRVLNPLKTPVSTASSSFPYLLVFLGLISLGTLLLGTVSHAEESSPLEADELTVPKAQAACICSKRQVIGATACIREVSSGASFLARVDTGAETCSLHVNKIIVDGASERMRRNWGKSVRFSVTVKDAETGKEEEMWIESKIHQTVIVKTSEEQERRYKVWLTLQNGKIQKRVHVTLNDRSEMDYPLLIGRNFLRDDFVVDVSKDIKK